MGHQLLRCLASQDDVVEGDGGVASQDDAVEGDGGTSAGSGGGAEGARVHVKWSTRNWRPDVGAYVRALASP